MERAFNQEERIKRAEELYYNRQERLNSRQKVLISQDIPKKKHKLVKKMVIQILVCVGIYSGICVVMKNNDQFSIDSMNYLKEIMGYEIPVNEVMENIKNYVASLALNEKKHGEDGEENADENTLGIYEEINENNVEEINNVEAKDEVIEEASSVSQMEQDAKYIKENFSLIKPLTGIITSRFGLRNPTTATVPKYHTGIDIAVNEGTVYVSAMEGTVELVSSQGDYRKPCKNYKWGCNDIICTL